MLIEIFDDLIKDDSVSFNAKAANDAIKWHKICCALLDACKEEEEEREKGG